MELSSELAQAFDDQITLELQAAIVYRQLGIELAALGLPGMASWMSHQAEEEQEHAEKFTEHVLDRGGRPRIGAIAQPDVPQSPTVLQIFEGSLAHEQMVSEAIRELYRKAEQAGDLDARPLLHWFIDEQIEEEATVGGIIAQLQRIGDDGPGLLRLDDALGQRGEE